MRSDFQRSSTAFSETDTPVQSNSVKAILLYSHFYCLNNIIMHKYLLQIFTFCLSLFILSCNVDDMQPEETCSDGILNGTETEIDCGGDCEACLPTSTHYFVGEIGGVEILVEEGGSLITSSSINTESNTDACHVGFTGRLAKALSPGSQPQIEITFENVFLSNCIQNFEH